MIDEFKASRRAGVPIVAIETPDIAATVKKLQDTFPSNPLIQYDYMRKAQGLNDTGLERIMLGCKGKNPKIATDDPFAFLNIVDEMSQTVMESEGPVFQASNCIIMFHNAHRFLMDQDRIREMKFIQAMQNLRDRLKAIRATLVLLGPAFMLPDELKNDIIIISEPYPTAADATETCESIIKRAEESGLSIEPYDIVRIADTVTGMPAFAAEQTTAMSIMPKNGSLRIDMEFLWNQACKQISQTKGLSVYRGKETFADCIGYDNAKDFLKRKLTGKGAPKLILFIDEIDKDIAASQSDSSGVTQAFNGKFLKVTQDYEFTGNIFIGPPGAAKSLVAKASGSCTGIKVICMSMSDMKGSLVGQSEQAIDEAFKVIIAKSQGKVHMIATCNNFTGISPEIKRRFSDGIFYFDLPTMEELAGILQYYIDKYDLKEWQLKRENGSPLMLEELEGWTGAEIKNASRIAYEFDCTLAEASRKIVPVSKRDPEALERLRMLAHNNLISASYDGVYQYNKKAFAATQKREFNMEVK